jgi:hypothetical protein
LSITGTKIGRKEFILALMPPWTNGYSSTGHHPPVEKKDIFKILMTVQGPNHNTGEIATIVSVNGGSRVKLFDDYKTFYKG